jgi:hypothetical protein
MNDKGEGYLSLIQIFCMARKCFFLVLLFIVSRNDTYCQVAGDYLFGIQTDLVKTDNSKPLNKLQFGAEVNYFIKKEFTATTGIEVWTADEMSFIIGTRWYPAEEGFIRVRGLIGENVLSIGGGWGKPLNPSFRFEAIADYYFSIDFSIRIGFVYILRRDKEKL